MKQLFLNAIFVFLLILSGCDGSSGGPNTSNDGGDDNTPNTGTYVSEQVNDNGTSLTLPSRVTITDLDGDNAALMEEMDLSAYSDYTDCVFGCSETYATDQEQLLECVIVCASNSGLADQSGAFSISITLSNSGSTTETVIINAGTVFSPGSSGYQPMMIIEDIELDVAPGSHSFMLPVFCLAPDKSAPDASNSYTITGLATEGCLQDILAILATKTLSSFTYADTSTVQDNIWNCVEGYPVDTAALNALP